ncbi:MAG: hypothetical protein ACKO6J_04060 [Crocinitomicaceae bacterium]
MKNFLILGFLLSFRFVLADSPLTSTYFADAYKNEKIIQYAQKRQGKIDRKLIRFISSEKASLELKLACINALGWNIDNQSNAPLLLKTLLKNNKCYTRDELMQRGDAKDLLCYAYLLSLDNYHDVEMAKIISQIAVDNEPNSYTFQIINGLIQAQYLFDSDWCEVYRVCDNVRSNSQLKDDFSSRAKEIIFHYMNLYSSYCE